MNMERKNKQSNKQFIHADEGRSHIKDSYLAFIWLLFLTAQTACDRRRINSSILQSKSQHCETLSLTCTDCDTI